MTKIICKFGKFSISLFLVFLSVSMLTVTNAQSDSIPSKVGDTIFDKFGAFFNKFRGQEKPEPPEEDGVTTNNGAGVLLHKYKRPSARVLDKLGRESHLGRNPLTGERCLISEDEDAIAVFDKFMPCRMNGLYTEVSDDVVKNEFNPDIIDLYEGELPQSYSLQVNKEGMEEFCQCTLEKPEMAQGDSDSSETKEKVFSTIVNLSVDRLKEQIDGFQKQIAYTLSSREMNHYLQQSEQENEEAYTTLYQCVPSEMAKFLKRGQSRGGGRLCGERGLKNMASSLNLTSNADPSFQIGRHLESVTDRGPRGSSKNTKFFKVLNRHWALDNNKESGNSSFERIENFEGVYSQGRESKHSREFHEAIQTSRKNEFSEEGRLFWKKSMQVIDKAFAQKLGGAEITFEGVDFFSFKKLLERSPFLEKRLLANLGTNDPHELYNENKLKKALKGYIENDLHPAFVKQEKHLNNHLDYDLDYLMALTYASDYSELLHSCEEVQKTMISLCRALDHEPGEGEMSNFFSDARLVDLYAEDLNKMQKGEAAPEIYEGFGQASKYFCQEASSDEALEKINQRQVDLQRDFALNPHFGAMEKERLTAMIVASPDHEQQGATMASLEATDEDPNHNAILDYESTVQKAVTNSQNVYSRPVNEWKNRDKEIFKKNHLPHKYAPNDSMEPPLKNPITSKTNGQKSPLGSEASIPTDQRVGTESQSSKAAGGRVFDRFRSGAKESGPFDINPELGNAGNSFSNPLGGGETTLVPNEGSLAERNLKTQLEQMREREAKMMAQIEQLAKKMEEDGKSSDELEQKEEEVSQLQKQMENLKKELAEVKSSGESERRAPAAARVERNPTGAGLFGNASNRRPLSADRRTQSPVNPAPSRAAVPTSSGSSSAPSRGSVGSSSDSTGRAAAGLSSSGQIAFSGTQSAPAAQIRIPTQATVSPPDTSLTSLALSAQGNVAFRETKRPGIVERVIFKMKDGQILFENGHPVVDKQERVSVEEAEAEEEASQESARKPASLEETMMEIEREVRPRARHGDLIDTLQQNTEN